VAALNESILTSKIFDELFSFRGAAKEVVLLGPGTPFYPVPFFSREITAIMGTRIFDPLTMLTVVSEAGGTKKLHQIAEKR